MSEENKALAQRFIEEVWNNRNTDVIDEIVASNYVYHSPPPGLSPDREGFKQFVAIYLAAYPDAHIHIDDQIAEGGKVATRWTGHGTHQGEFMGIPATGKKMTVTGITIERMAGGQIVEGWDEFDMMGMMVQLGVVPPPGG